MTAHLPDVEKLYLGERDGLKRLARRILRNSAAVDDIVQQAFANITARFNHDGYAPNPAYVRAAVRNLAFNYLRTLKRRADIEVHVDNTEAIADASPSPEDIIIYRRELMRLLEAIASLPPRRREAFILNRIDGLTYDEIAIRMNISRNTVITSIAMAMADLDRRLG